jgi:hypothetical protein
LAKAIIETLEDRQHLSVSTDADGWTVVTPGTGARVVYVSSSAGNDSADGLSSATPLKTIGKARTLIRDGAGDQLLLKRGDKWNEGLGYWRASGKSANEPTFIGAYGEGARPELQVTGAYAFGAGSASAKLSHVVVSGIRMYAVQRDPSSPSFDATKKSDGIYIAGNIDNLKFEDIDVQFFRNNFVVTDYYAPVNNFAIRRSTIANAWSDTSQHSQGVYLQGVHGILIEGNTFNHNGWNAQYAPAKPTIFNHNIYVQGTCTGFVARGNIFSNAASHGMQARVGGIVEDNLFVNNAIGLSYGLVNGSGPLVAGGVTGAVRGNVFIGSKDIAGQKRGIGLEIANTAVGGNTIVEKNIFTTDREDGVFAAINLTWGNNQNNGSLAAGLNDLTVRDNIAYKWYRGLWVNAELSAGGTGPRSVNGLKLENNDYQETRSSNIVYQGIGLRTEVQTLSNNRYFSANAGGAPFYLGGKTFSPSGWVSAIEPNAVMAKANYVDPNRSLTTLSLALGNGGSETAFLSAAVANSRTGYNKNYTASSANAYIRAGFVDRGDTTPAIPQGYTFTPTDPDDIVTVPPPPPTPVDPGTGGGSTGGGSTGGGSTGGGSTGGGTTTPGGSTDGGSTGGGTTTPTTPVDPGPVIPDVTGTPGNTGGTTTPTTPTNPPTVPTDPGYRAEIGADGKIIVVWTGGPTPGTPTTPTNPDDSNEEEPGTNPGTSPDVTYVPSKTPTIVYGNGVWYVL